MEKGNFNSSSPNFNSNSNIKPIYLNIFYKNALIVTK